MPENVLVVGGTAREMAIAESIALSHNVNHIFCVPGNAGTEALPKVENVNLWQLDVDGITQFASDNRDDLFVVIGARGPQVRGLGDRLRAQEIPVFGASAAAAELERSKIFAKHFMDRYDIPHPTSEVATDYNQAINIIKDPLSCVIKADADALGRGVVLPKDFEETRQTLQAMFSGQGFNGAGKAGVVIQERLTGPERSVFVLCSENNHTIIPFVAQDYKRFQDGDKGPNTGGMGSYALMAAEMMTNRQFEAVKSIADKTIAGMAHMGRPFHGVLYLGLMLAKEYDNQPIVLEFNIRFGDPEAQVILPLLTAANIDMHTVFYETATSNAPEICLPPLIGKAALTVSCMAQGYPDNPQKGAVIHGLENLPPDIKAYHSNTQRSPHGIEVTGGRVLDITAIDKSVEAAAKKAYAHIGRAGIHFYGMQYRTDIGKNY